MVQAGLWVQLLTWLWTSPLHCQIKSRNGDGKDAFFPTSHTFTLHRHCLTWEHRHTHKEKKIKCNQPLPRRLPMQLPLHTGISSHEFFTFIISSANLVRSWENYWKLLVCCSACLASWETTDKKTWVWKESSESTWTQSRGWDHPSVSARSLLSPLNYICMRQDLISVQKFV